MNEMHLLCFLWSLVCAWTKDKFSWSLTCRSAWRSGSCPIGSSQSMILWYRGRSWHFYLFWGLSIQASPNTCEGAELRLFIGRILLIWKIISVNISVIPTKPYTACRSSHDKISMDITIIMDKIIRHVRWWIVDSMTSNMKHEEDAALFLLW